jgi:hypothetical protein
MLPRIIKVIDVLGFQLVCEWNTGEVRAIDFENLILSYPQNIKEKFLNPDFLKTVKYNKESRTIYFAGMIKGKDTNGNEFDGDLDFCPDVLYANSVRSL